LQRTSAYVLCAVGKIGDRIQGSFLLLVVVLEVDGGGDSNGRMAMVFVVRGSDHRMMLLVAFLVRNPCES
jgi:ribosomal protein S6E (S10)